jgi:hypothetical protein
MLINDARAAVRAKCCTAIWPQLIGDPTAMLELVRLAQATLVAALRGRRRLVVENLLLRQQLQVALRSLRRRRLRARDKLFWLLVRRLHRDWRRQLFLVRPETVLGWHRRGSRRTPIRPASARPLELRSEVLRRPGLAALSTTRPHDVVTQAMWTGQRQVISGRPGWACDLDHNLRSVVQRDRARVPWVRAAIHQHRHHNARTHIRGDRLHIGHTPHVEEVA